MYSFLNLIRSFYLFFSRSDVFCFLVLWFIVLLTIGTIMQQDIGLHAVQDKHFKSFVFWVSDYIPLPGIMCLLVLFFIGLLFRTFNGLNIKKIGTFVIHIGVLLLLFGGFLTSYFSKEGFMVMRDNVNVSAYVDQNHYDLIVIKNKIVISRLELSKLSEYEIDNNILSLNIKDISKNASLSYKNVPLKEYDALGISRFFNLLELPMFLDNDYNNFAVYLDINLSYGKKSSCILIENKFSSISFSVNNDMYELILVKSLRILPFSVSLISFKKDVYFKSAIPKNYTSVILIKDGDFSWKYPIKMNQPLRYKGFAFYQSSFIEQNGDISSVLLVTKDYGEFFPYIALCVLFVGFILHLFRLLRL